jgi:outer membrane cobalamin receptor
MNMLTDPQASVCQCLVAAVLSSAMPVAIAQTSTGGQTGGNPPPLEEIVVFGRGLELLGSADAATEGSVGGADLLVRPMLKVAELLEAVPGLVAAQHSGSGKANQYFLRGVNLDHGFDFTTYVDGAPWNLRSHGHGQGYLDVNGLLPEVVDRIEYRKGPYRGDVGDFAMVGASFIRTIDRFDAPFVSLESGNFGWGRLAGGGSVDVGDGVLTGIAQVKQYDGPWQRDEGFEHFAVWGKYLRPTSFGDMTFTLSGYEGDWHPTEQVAERAIGTPVCADAFCTLDPTADGDTSRWIGTVQLTAETWDASAYVQHYDWFMQSNPTYDAQINQFDKRWTIGGRYNRTLLESESFEVLVGGDFRYDDIGPVGLDNYDGGVFVSNISDNAILETSIGMYVDASWYVNDELRVFGALRADYFDFDVDANSPGSFAGSTTDSLVMPKIGLAYAMSDQVELYANWGEGFHSNDARGVVNAADPIPGLSQGTGQELGGRFEIGDFKITAAYWWLDQDSELIFVGDSNSVEPKGASERDGYELTVFWRPYEWLGIDAVYTESKAHYVDNPEGRYIEGSVEHSGQFGISAVQDRWEASMRLRYLGPYAMTPDNAQRAESLTTVGLRGAYNFDTFTVYAEVINVFDSDGKDIAYWYPAYIAGLDPAGLTSGDIDCATVNCRMSRATEPRTFRVGLKYGF